MEYFGGLDPLLSEAELNVLDRLDSELSREQGEGLWGTDEYGIVTAVPLEEASTSHAVGPYHSYIQENVQDEIAPIDDPLRKKFNDVLWKYSERVVGIVQQRVEGFVWSSEVETWQN